MRTDPMAFALVLIWLLAMVNFVATRGLIKELSRTRRNTQRRIRRLREQYRDLRHATLGPTGHEAGAGALDLRHGAGTEGGAR